MVQGRDRRVELGYQLAIACRTHIVNMPGTGYPLKNRNAKYNIPLDEKLAEQEKADAEAAKKAEEQAEDASKKE